MLKLEFKLDEMSLKCGGKAMLELFPDCSCRAEAKDLIECSRVNVVMIQLWIIWSMRNQAR